MRLCCAVGWLCLTLPLLTLGCAGGGRAAPEAARPQRDGADRPPDAPSVASVPGAPDGAALDRPAAAPVDGGAVPPGPLDTAAPMNARPVLRPPAAPAPAPAGDCAMVTGARLTRLAEHPAGGWEVTVRLAFADGVPPVGKDLRSCVRLEDDKGTALPTAVAARPTTHAHILLLVDPGTTADDGRVVLQTVRALLGARPQTERYLVYRWAAAVTQVASSFVDRRMVEARLPGGLTPAPGPRSSLDAALAAVGPGLEAVGGPGWDQLKAVVVISPRALALPSRPALEALPALGLFVAPGAAVAVSTDVPVGLRVSLDPATPAGAALAIGRILDGYTASGHLAIGHCGTGEGGDAAVRVTGRPTTRPLTLPPHLWENLAGRCDFGALAGGRRVFPRRIELSFTPEQRARMEEAAFFRSTADWTLNVRLSPDHLPTTAAAHFRGQSSFACARRNYALEMPGRRPRFLLPGSAQTKFTLVSMCDDDAYLGSHTVASLLAEEGLFAGAFDLVELAVDGQSRGVYFLTENVTEALRQQLMGVTGVVRLYLAGPQQLAEPYFSATTPEDAVAAHQQLLVATAGLTGRPLEQALRSRMDLDQYLRWIAYMVTFGSGDYVDEVFFVSTASTNAAGQPSNVYSFSSWDNDDLFSPCHAGGRNAIEDAYGLLYCTESDLDRRIFADEALYRRYADILAETLARVDRKRFEGALRATVAKVTAVLADPQALAASIELRRIDPQATISLAAARATLEGRVTELLTRFDDNRKELLERLRIYRSGAAPPDLFRDAGVRADANGL